MCMACRTCGDTAPPFLGVFLLQRWEHFHARESHLLALLLSANVLCIDDGGLGSDSTAEVNDE